MKIGHSDVWRDLTHRAARQIAEARHAARDVDAAELARALLEDDPNADAALRARLQGLTST